MNAFLCAAAGGLALLMPLTALAAPLTIKDSGTSVSIARHDTLIVKLDAEGSIGMWWNWVASGAPVLLLSEKDRFGARSKPHKRSDATATRRRHDDRVQLYRRAARQNHDHRALCEL